MTKREFLQAFGAAAMALGAPLRAAAAPRTLKNWVWMRPKLDKRPEEWKRDFALMRASGVHAINIEIYNGREAFYVSRRFPVKAAFLETLIPIAAAERLEVHAWMWTMPCLVDEVLKTHPDWYNVNAKGESAADKPAYVNYYKFLDPARPEVRDFVQGTVREIAQVRGLTGIHLDYGWESIKTEGVAVLDKLKDLIREGNIRKRAGPPGRSHRGRVSAHRRGRGDRRRTGAGRGGDAAGVTGGVHDRRGARGACRGSEGGR
jgi:uncharacterized lipoprotein YddW (UPF0748 family)